MFGGRPAQSCFPWCLGQARHFLGGLQMFRRDFYPSQFPSEAVCGLLFGSFAPLLFNDQFFSLSFPLGSWTETHRACSSLQCPSF